MATARLEAFSDGVFAIAATLLVLEIKVPHVHEGASLLSALGRQWPSYAAFAVSFATIGIIWVNHHAVYARVTRVDRALLFANLGLLLWVSFIPFPTALVAEYLREGRHETVATALYAGTFLAMGFAFFAMREVAVQRGLLQEGERPEWRWRNLVGQGGYVLAVGLAFVAPGVSLALCGAVAVYYVLPAPMR